jgi:RNA polymerase primary sigma factor
MDFEQQQSRLRELIAHGKKQGFVTYAEINDHLLEDIISEAEQQLIGRRNQLRKHQHFR